MTGIDDSYQVTPLENLLNGIADAVKARYQRGSTVVSVPAGNTQYTKTITFPVAFPSTPRVYCNPITSRPADVFATPTTFSTTQMTITVQNNVGAFDITVHWEAGLP